MHSKMLKQLRLVSSHVVIWHGVEQRRRAEARASAGEGEASPQLNSALLSCKIMHFLAGSFSSYFTFYLLQLAYVSLRFHLWLIFCGDVTVFHLEFFQNIDISHENSSSAFIRLWVRVTRMWWRFRRTTVCNLILASGVYIFSFFFGFVSSSEIAFV